MLLLAALSISLFGSKIDQEKISAQLDDGVLTLTLKKTKEATPRSISIS
jgi:HSP20 family molecular chaperone IbpA